MRRFRVVVCAVFMVTDLSKAQPERAVPPAHASRGAAVALLRHEGILHGRTRVVSAEWSDSFWLIRLHHPSGLETNWTVDAAARNYSFVCKN